MSQRLGKAYIKADGKLLETMKGAKIDIGGQTRTPVVGNKVHGFAEEEKEATLECQITVGGDTSLDELRKITDATVTFECDTGQTYVMRHAWLVDPPSVTEGEGGKVELKFASAPAEEMKK